MKERDSNTITAKVVENTKKSTLRQFFHDNVQEGSEVITDDLSSYQGLVDFDHKSVMHSVVQYVREQAHINGMESFWAVLKRAHKGTFNKLSHKHLNRYIQEFAGRHNIRPNDTENQMAIIACGMVDKRLKYKDLIQ